MYTDGITEHMSKDHNKRYDEDLFQKAILNSKTLDSQNSADDLIRAAREYVGTNDFADDVTVLLVDRI